MELTKVFNKPQKQAFLEYLPEKQRADYLKHLQRFFDQEQAIGKDICEMDYDGWVSVLKSIPITTFGDLRTYSTAMETYLEWCRDNGAAINREAARKLLPKFYTDEFVEEMLTPYISKHYEPKIASSLYQASSPYPAYKGYLHCVIIALSWLGLRPREMIKLKNEDVTVTDDLATVKYRGVCFTSDDEAVISILNDYMSVMPETPLWRQNFVAYQMDTEYFMKRVTRDTSSAQKSLSTGDVSHRIVMLNDTYNMHVSLMDIRRAGLYYQISKMEQLDDDAMVDVFVRMFELPPFRAMTELKTYKVYKKIFNL